MNKFAFGLILSSFAVAGPSSAGDANLGAQKATVCAACHGPTGSSLSPEWPNLAGQGEAYIAQQLAAFKSGERVNPLMTPMAAVLSEEDMKDLGAHFSQQTPAGGEADASNWKAGETLYRAGDKERDIPACIACHGPQGRGNGPAKYPALRAQHSVYTFNQLKAYKDGSRKSSGNGIMQAVTERMTEEQMRAVASYVQGLR